MKLRVPKAYARAVATHRKNLEKVLTAQASYKMKALYDEAQDAVLARVKRSMASGNAKTFTAYQQKQVLTQLRQGQVLVAQKMTKGLQPLSKKAQEVSLRGLIEDVGTLNKVFTGAEITLPVEEAAVFAGVIDKRASSLLRRHETSMARYGTNLVQQVEKKMALGLLKGDSPGDMYQDVADAVGGEWWQGERIVRTEMAYAFNATHADGIEKSSEDIPELRMRWEEHCDEQGNPLDDRVAVDSLAMHGQVAEAGEGFTMPPTSLIPDANGNTSVSRSLVGLSWDFPPNRPNDRAVLAPWMKDWGVPGWEWRGGRRVWLVR